jgi:hypothetical protein
MRDSTLTSQGLGEDRFDGPSWHDAEQLITGAVSNQPGLAFPLWDAFNDVKELDNRAGLQSAVLQAQSSAVNSLTDWGALLDRVDRDVADLDTARWSVELFIDGLSERGATPSGSQINKMLALCSRWWRSFAVGWVSTWAVDGFMLGLNTLPGAIARFWIRAISVRWSNDREGWDGFSSNESEMLIEFIEDDEDAQKASRSIVASETYFLFAADPLFVTSEIFPLFVSSTDPAVAEQCWRAFLNAPRVNKKMLHDGFMDLLLGERDMIVALGDEQKRSYFELLASISIFSEVEVAQRLQLVRTIIDTNADAEVVEFLGQLRWRIGDTESSSRESIFGELIAPLIELRANGIPREPTREELGAWADLFSLFPQCADAFLTLLGRRGFPLSRSGQALQDLADINFDRARCVEVVSYLEIVLANSTPADLSPIAEYELSIIVRKLVGVLGVQALTRTVELCLRLGMMSATQWSTISP